MLLGVAEERVAAPPCSVKTKSVVSKAPLPSLLLNTASLKVASMALLLDSSLKEETVGAVLSFKFAVLLVCVVLATLPTESNMALSTGTTASTSLPSGVPDKLMPKV